MPFVPKYCLYFQRLTGAFLGAISTVRQMLIDSMVFDPLQMVPLNCLRSELLIHLCVLKCQLKLKDRLL